VAIAGRAKGSEECTVQTCLFEEKKRKAKGKGADRWRPGGEGVLDEKATGSE